jgi:hypothetical protein
MNDLSERHRAEVLALINQALRDGEKTAPPAEVERKGWLKGEFEWGEPDEHGWFAMVLGRPDVWVPKALVTWQITLQLNATLARELLDNPCLSLARWPDVEAAVRRLYAI